MPLTTNGHHAQVSFATHRDACWSMLTRIDWTSVNVFSKLLRVIALVGGSVLSGPQLNRNEEWLDLSINYTVDLMKGARRLKEYPSYLHPILQYLLPEIRKMSHYYSSARRLVLPIMKERAQAAKDPGYVKPNDLLQWTVDKNEFERKKLSLNEQANIQLMAAFASIHTTSMACSHALYDLAAYPECLEPLREEIESVMTEQGPINKQSLTKLRKLDSFMKESQRMNPPGVGRFSLRSCNLRIKSLTNLQSPSTASYASRSRSRMAATFRPAATSPFHPPTSPWIPTFSPTPKPLMLSAFTTFAGNRPRMRISINTSQSMLITCTGGMASMRVLADFSPIKRSS